MLYFEDVSAGDEIPVLKKNASTQQLVMYAGASDDYYQIHYDKDLAASAGHKSVIIHGALKSAWLAQLVTDWAGPASQLTELSVAYRAIDYPYDDLTIRGRVTGKRTEQGQNLVDCDIWLENGEGETTTPGSATVSLPSRESA